MKKLVYKIILIFNFILAGLMIISSISVYISPEKLWFFAFIGLLFPFILIINILFLIFWLLTKRRYFFISLAVILLCWNNLGKFVQFTLFKGRTPVEATYVKLLSYNVRLFNYYNWLKIKSAHQDILSCIEKEDAGVICIQEFLTLTNTSFSEDSIKMILHRTPYAYIHYTDVSSDNKSLGLATFSKYPIVNKGYIGFENSPNASIFTDIKIHDDTIRLYNCHLQSTHLQKDNYNFLDSMVLSYSNRHLGQLRDITSRLKNAYMKRAGQVKILSSHIRKSPYPTLVCGDFNDTPVSYTYSTLKDNLKDAYLESGTGIGNTYFGSFPSFRIDYILHSKTIGAFGFKTRRVKLSDHYPIVCNFYLKEREP